MASAPPTPTPSPDGGRNAVDVRVIRRGSTETGGAASPSRELSSAGSLQRAATLAYADPRPASSSARVRVDVSRGSARAQTASSRGRPSRPGTASPIGASLEPPLPTHAPLRQDTAPQTGPTFAGALSRFVVPFACISVAVVAAAVVLLGVNVVDGSFATAVAPDSTKCFTADGHCALVSSRAAAYRLHSDARAVISYVDRVLHLMDHAVPRRTEVVSAAACNEAAAALRRALRSVAPPAGNAALVETVEIAGVGINGCSSVDSVPVGARNVAVRFTGAPASQVTVSAVMHVNVSRDITVVPTLSAAELRRAAHAAVVAASTGLAGQHIVMPALGENLDFKFFPEATFRDFTAASVPDAAFAIALCLLLLLTLVAWGFAITAPKRASTAATGIVEHLLVDTADFHPHEPSRPGTATDLCAADSLHVSGATRDFSEAPESMFTSPHQLNLSANAKRVSRFAGVPCAPLPELSLTPEARAVACAATDEGVAIVDCVTQCVQRLKHFLAYVPAAAVATEPSHAGASSAVFAAAQSSAEFLIDTGGFEEVRPTSRCSTGSESPRNVPLVIMGADQLENLRSGAVSPANPATSVFGFSGIADQVRQPSILGRVPSPQDDDDTVSLSKSGRAASIPEQRPDSAAVAVSNYVFPFSSSHNTPMAAGSSRQPTGIFLENPGGASQRKRSSAATSQMSGDGGGVISPLSSSMSHNPLAGQPPAQSLSFEDTARRLSAMPTHRNRRMSALSVFAHDELRQDEVVADAIAGGGGGIPSVIRMKRCTVVHCRLSMPSLEDGRLPRGFMLGIVHDTSQTFLEAALKTAAAFDGVTAAIGLTHAVFAWNAFRPYQFHESRAALCALHLEQALREALETDRCRIASPRFYICAVTGHSIAGTVAAGSTAYPVLAGENAVLARGATMLAPVLRATTLLAETTYSIAKAHVTAVPRDTIGTELQRLVLFELKGEVMPGSPRSADASRRDAAYMNAFSLMRQGKYDEANAELEKLLESAGPSADVATYRWAWLMTQYAIENPAQLQLMVQMAKNPNARPPSSDDGAHQTNTSGPNNGLFRRFPQWLLHEERFDDLEAVDDMEVQTPTEAMSDGFSSVDAPSTEPRTRRYSQTDFSADPALRTALTTRSLRSTRATDSPSVDGVVPLPPVTVTDAAMEENPNVLFDDRGERWTRSERILGRGTYGVVRVGLSTDGSLGAMKYMPLTSINPSGPGSTGGSNRGDSRGGGGTDSNPLAGSGSGPGSSSNAARIESALAEVGILSKLRHPSIVRYVSCSVQRDDFVVILEYCGGGSLGRLIALFGALPMPVVQRYARDILTGLNYLHKHGVTHRDLSLNNVLLTIDGECKLSDFGGSVTRSTSAPMTMGNVLGTPAFMAPETCTGQISMMSDIWSFGIMLCIMASGRLPYDEELLSKPVDFLRRLATDDKFGPAIPREVTERRELHTLVLSCLKREVMERPWAESLLMHPFFMS